MLIDSHCHLDYFSEEEREGIVQNALNNGLNLYYTKKSLIFLLNYLLRVFCRDCYRRSENCGGTTHQIDKLECRLSVDDNRKIIKSTGNARL